MKKSHKNNQRGFANFFMYAGAFISFLLFSLNSFSQNVAIIESESYNPGHQMDNVWLGVATNMGMTASIEPQSFLYDTSFFAGTDALIVSSGVILLTNSQITTITQFMQSGKSIYLQGEYDCSSYNTNTTFASLVNTYGGNFTLGGIVAGTLAPMTVLGTLSTTPNVVTPLSYFWYGCKGTACSYVEPFLQFNNDYFGFTFCPPVSNYGHVVYTSDQDWVNQSTSIPLLQNILSRITSNNYQCSGPNYLGANLGIDTTICSDSVYVLLGGSSAFTYQWSTGATDTSITVNTAGTYWVTVTNGACTASDTVIISTIPCNSSQVSFVASDTMLCEKFCINFFDSSSNNPTSWHWIFPGGSPASSTQQNPANICYDVPGVYDVTLITTSANGSDTLTLPSFITVNATPPFPIITQNGYILTSSSATSYQWQFNSYDIPGATNQSYAVMQSGFYTVIVGDENGCVNSASTYVLISGINDAVNDAIIFISPNPSSGNFAIEFPGTEISGELTIDVVNALGQNVFSSTENISSTDFKKQVSLSNASNGVYFITLRTQKISLQKKLVISK